MFEASTYKTGRVTLAPGDLLAVYSDGITEAENPAGRPFDEGGLEEVLLAERDSNVAAIGAAVVRAVERAHARRQRFADDLTLLAAQTFGMPRHWCLMTSVTGIRLSLPLAIWACSLA